MSRMPPALREAYRAELAAARKATAEGRVALAFAHLERAHILSQRHTREHVHVHALMLRLGAATRSWREVAGQSMRIVAAAIFSRLWVPIGNTGRAGVSAFRPMPVPQDLRALIEGATPDRARPRGARGS